jgi:hypothetical protein
VCDDIFNSIAFIFRHSTVGMAITYALGGLAFESRHGQIFLFPKTSRPSLGPTQPQFDVYQGSFHWLKRPGREVNHSPQIYKYFLLPTADKFKAQCGVMKPTENK